MISIGVIREGKKPYDKRTPLTPAQCVSVMQFFPGTKVVVQPSGHRCFKDEEYAALGIELNEDLSACSILLGVKEVPVDQLLPNKTYLFFSHTIKKQAHNRNLLREILKQNIRLVDYETLVWEAGNRIIGFGRFAGIVGSHYALLMWGRKHGLYSLKAAHECRDMAEMLAQYEGMNLPPMRIVLCGDGRVGHGALELLRKLKVHQVSQEEFLYHDYNEAIYVHLRSEDYYAHRDGRFWDKSDFYKHPEDYESVFKPFYQKADIMINGVFWKDGIAPFFTHEEMKGADFRIKVISDITCDIPGPLPCTLRSTVIGNPFYGYNPMLEKEVEPFLPNVIDMQTVANLPCELPVDASMEFGEQLIRHVLPSLLVEDSEHIIANATIAQDGKLTEKFKYLEDFVA
ncbi:MAG: NAD(P)-dependent oxidoreductase [Bacteroidia bacterium]|nr:NAD(P)-dependent oxidoreductase [Bacteroidia bacterium]